MKQEDMPLSQQGFELFKAKRVRRINSTHFLVRTESDIGSYAVELQDGNWACDCDPNLQECPHRYAVRLAAVAARIPEPVDGTDDAIVVCRYCGSPDVSRCGFRYNVYGMSRRLRCNECLRKFSVKYTDSRETTPSEMTWLLAEIGMVLVKLEDLIEKISLKGKERAEGTGE